MVAMTGVGIIAENAGIVESWYGSPFVALVAVVANRLGMRSALVAAVLGAIAHNYFFAGGVPRAFVWPSAAEWTIYLSMLAVAVLVARPRPTTATRVYDGGSNLPFTNRTTDTDKDGKPGGLHSTGWLYWDVRPSGSWPEDCHVGQEYCRIWVSRARRNEPRPLLSWIIHDMIRSRKWTGVEAGFASALEGLALKKVFPPSNPAERPPQS